MSAAVELTKKLISCPSITPKDAGCFTIISKHLEKIGFEIEYLPYGEVNNLWARRGDRRPLFTFLGHIDVVPSGATEAWTSPPFSPEERDGYLFGRGAADMKSNIAAMLTAFERFIEQYSQHNGSLSILLTSDEEGPSIDGTAKVIQHLQARGEKIDWCLVGEPTSHSQIGDTIKIGRRGSLSAQLKIYGKQGHIAYPHLADNPIHRALPALKELTHIEWDKGNQFFPATSLQISNIYSGTGATNVIPGEIDIKCNFRYSTCVTAEELQARFISILEEHGLSYSIDWTHSGKPFLTSKGKLIETTCSVIQEITGLKPELSTSGGTSDGRFIAPTGSEVVELGVLNATIHQINECVKIEDIQLISEMYERILIKLLAT